MTSCEKTSIVYNEPSKLLGLPPYYYRYRSCDTNLTSNTPANQYQRLKQIQNTVRVQGSLYVANLGPLTAYKKPIADPQQGLYGVCWKQMSDRPLPSVQRATIPTGQYTAMNRRHTSVTSSKPGCQTPGGAGCDIKHNSYDRYLNRLKGKGPMRRGVIPPTFGAPIPFNCAVPVYGGKTTKTNIVNGCYCPDNRSVGSEQNVRIYNNPLWQADPSGNCGFSVGSYVYAIEAGTKYYQKGTIIAINEETTPVLYTVEFSDGATQDFTYAQLKVYYSCNCDGVLLEEKSLAFRYVDSSGIQYACNVPYPGI